MQYDNTNSGVLFKNQSENEKAPAYKGKINVDGKDYELAAWIREGKSGKFMSLKVQEPRQKQAPAPQKDFNDMEDDVPWSIDLTAPIAILELLAEHDTTSVSAILWSLRDVLTEQQEKLDELTENLMHTYRKQMGIK
jgi:hypothetical protein